MKLNIRPDGTLSLIEKNVRNTLELIGTKNNFLTWTIMIQALRPTTNSKDQIKQKCSRQQRTPLL